MIYDISPPVTPSLAVWPGDTPPSREVLRDMAHGDSLTLSTLHATVHLGAHADAPSHYAPDGPTIDRRPLERYLGPAQVMRVAAERGGVVSPAGLGGPVRAERVLLATGTYPDVRVFHRDFAALTVDLVEFLHERGVVLVGTDTPSVDRFESQELPVHAACLRHDVAILEGLVLDEVPDGVYELIALPLRLVGFDGSPVRAVLRPTGD
jgi:arylformamidase